MSEKSHLVPSTCIPIHTTFANPLITSGKLKYNYLGLLYKNKIK